MTSGLSLGSESERDRDARVSERREIEIGEQRGERERSRYEGRRKKREIVRHS